MIRILAIAAFWMVAAGPAHAAPLVTAITAIGAALASNIVLKTVVQVVVTVAVAAFQQRRMEKQVAAAAQAQSQAQARAKSGITTEFASAGGTLPLTVIVGTYATAGHLDAPPMSWPANSNPANIYLTYIIGLGDLAGIRPTGRVAINDQWHQFSGETGLGRTVEGAFNELCWFRFRDGFETAADAMLMANLASHDQRPWAADMIGRGIPHVIATFKRDQAKFPSEPKLLFEVTGIPLYDPRRDSSVGGSGTQRWSNRSTWAYSDNPKVIEYNIHRGLVIDGYGIWGNKVAAADLPLDNWFAAMNACDVLVSNGEGGSERAYVFGFEWALDVTPASIIDEINRSCAGETVEIGGIYKTRVGGVGLPVYFFTDDDIIVTRAQDLEPFVGLDETFNALSCSFPDPRLIWQSREAPPLTNAAWEAEDGQLEYDEDAGGFMRRPRRLLKQMSLPAVANHRQVQRLLASAAREGRNRRSHALTLPPEALMLEPLDAVSWTSLHNGFAGKIFDVVLTVDPVMELRPRIGLLEADPNDYTVPEYQAFAAPDISNPAQTILSVPGVPMATERLYRTRVGSGLKVAVRFIAQPSPSPDVRGYQWQRLIDGRWRDLARSTAPDIELQDADLGQWTVRLRAEGIAESVSNWVEQSIAVLGVAVPPTALVDVSLQSAGGLALLAWQPHADLDVAEGGEILVRYSASLAPTWENSHTGWRTFGRNTSIIVPLMQGSYLLRAQDASGNFGPVTTIGTDGIQAARFVNAGLMQEDDEFAGTHEGTRTEDGMLYLTSALMFDDEIPEELDELSWDYAGGVLLTGVYNFATMTDLGNPRPVRLRAHVLQEPVNMIDYSDSPEEVVDETEDWDGVAGAQCSVLIEVQTTQTDPASAPVWSVWIPVQSTEITARGIRARARLTSSNANVSPQVTQLRIYIDEVL